MKELDLTLDQIPEGLLADFLLASAYLLGLKRTASWENVSGRRGNQ